MYVHVVPVNLIQCLNLLYVILNIAFFFRGESLRVIFSLLQIIDFLFSLIHTEHCQILKIYQILVDFMK